MDPIDQCRAKTQGKIIKKSNPIPLFLPQRKLLPPRLSPYPYIHPPPSPVFITQNLALLPLNPPPLIPRPLHQLLVLVFLHLQLPLSSDRNQLHDPPFLLLLRYGGRTERHAIVPRAFYSDTRRLDMTRRVTGRRRRGEVRVYADRAVHGIESRERHIWGRQSASLSEREGGREGILPLGCK
jgi:hypothetical protein